MNEEATKPPADEGRLEAPVGRPVPKRNGDGALYCWLVEEFGADGNSTGRYMLDQGALTITANVHEARQFLRMRTAMFRAKDMREKHGGDWRHAHHGFVVANKTPNARLSGAGTASA